MLHSLSLLEKAAKQVQILGTEITSGPSDLGGEVSLFFEHLEEASFLWEQWRSLLDDPEVTWLDIEDFEVRFEAHIDALVLGGAVAIAVCRQQAREGDAGELHAALRVFARLNRLELAIESLEGLDESDGERFQAARDALCHELPDSWIGYFIDQIEADDPIHALLAVHLVGYHRLDNGARLQNVLNKVNSSNLIDVISALGRTLARGARLPLYDSYLHHENTAVCLQASLTLLRLGEEQTIHYCTSLIHKHAWTLLPIGLGGSRSDISKLLYLASVDAPPPDVVKALGLLGDVVVVDLLLGHLYQADLAGEAAQALHLITGAPLYEEVFIPDEIDEDMLFEDELERYRRGESLVPEGETPPGTTLVRLAQDAEIWQKWWLNNQRQFKTGIRYRNGIPYTPATVFETLVSERSPRIVRQWAYEELVIRYNLDLAFETDMPVAQQRKVLARISGWIQEKASAFQPGKWYFNGRVASW